MSNPLSAVTLIDVDGSKVWATPEQSETIATLAETRKGGFARVYGYIAESGRVSPTVYDATVLTRWNYSRLLQRQIEAIEAITPRDILEAAKGNEKLAKLSVTQLEETLNARKAMEIASRTKTLDGDRDDAYRAAHDRCYLNISDGVLIHYQTEKNAEGIKVPVLKDGFPIAESIMMNVLEIGRYVREPGEYKTVNSGAPVIISNLMKSIMKERGVRSMKRITLKPGKFERVAIDGSVVLPEDCITLLD